MNFYFSAERLAVYPLDMKEEYADNWPEDAVEITSEMFAEFFLKRTPIGKILGSRDKLPCWIDAPDNTQEILIIQELAWIPMELERVRDELEKVQDSDPKATGSVTDWRNYRKNIRAWPENIDFPNKNFRPVAPDA